MSSHIKIKKKESFKMMKLTNSLIIDCERTQNIYRELQNWSEIQKNMIKNT